MRMGDRKVQLIDEKAGLIADRVASLVEEDWLSSAFTEELKDTQGHDLAFCLFYAMSGIADFLDHVRQLGMLLVSPQEDWQRLLLEIRQLRPLDFGPLGSARAAVIETTSFLDAMIRAACASDGGVFRECVPVWCSEDPVDSGQTGTGVGCAILRLEGLDLSVARRAIDALDRLVSACESTHRQFEQWYGSLATSTSGDHRRQVVHGAIGMQVELHRLMCAVLVHQASWDSLVELLEKQ